MAAVLFFDRIRIDDPVGAISVHGVCGAFGTIMVGLFAVEDTEFWKAGLFYGGGVDQLVTQIVGVAAIAAFVGVTTLILFQVLKRTVGLRVEDEEEMDGLDVLEHGHAGYGEDVITVTGAPAPVRVAAR